MVCSMLPNVTACLLLLLLGLGTAVEQQGTSQLDVTKSTIQPTLENLPADDAVLIEFFASWCPACRLVDVVDCQQVVGCSLTGWSELLACAHGEEQLVCLQQSACQLMSASNTVVLPCVQSVQARV